MTLPLVSESLLRLCVPVEFQSEILGDLAEEYDRRCASSERAARRWIRRDVIIAAFSFPGAGMNLAIAAGAAAAAYSFAVVWEVFIASPLARLMAQEPLQPAQNFSWPLFLSAQMAGFAIAGALAALLIRRKRQGMLMNLLLGAAPLAGLAAAPVIIFAAINRDPGAVIERLDWIASASLAVAAGAFAAAMIARLRLATGPMTAA